MVTAKARVCACLFRCLVARVGACLACIFVRVRVSGHHLRHPTSSEPSSQSLSPSQRQLAVKHWPLWQGNCDSEHWREEHASSSEPSSQSLSPSHFQPRGTQRPFVQEKRLSGQLRLPVNYECRARQTHSSFQTMT